VRTPLIIRWPEKFPAGQLFEKTVSNFDYFPTITTATGATLPAGLPGRDLAWVVASDADIDNPLFWEASNSEIHGWAGLSHDGRWRMNQYFVGEPVLNDLQSNPSGELDVLADNPGVAASLHEAYLDWRHKRRLVPFEYRRFNTQGHATLRGSSLQRSPGFGGNTFAIAVTPASRKELGGSVSGSTREIIADQQGQWSLTIEGGKLRAAINGITLEASSLPPGECSRVILASHFVFSALYPKLNHAQIQLYVNEVLVASKKIEQPGMSGDDLERPTSIGRDASGQFPFSGVLGRPVIYNERLVMESESNTKVENSIARIADKLCT